MSERQESGSPNDAIFSRVSEFCRTYRSDPKLYRLIADIIVELAVERLPDSAFDEAGRLPENICAIFPFGHLYGVECYTQEQVDFFTQNFSAEAMSLSEVRGREALQSALGLNHLNKYYLIEPFKKGYLVLGSH